MKNQGSGNQLYLGKDQWDGSRSLHELMTGGDEERGELFDKIKIYLPDYRMNLIEARRVEDIQLFKSSLQYFFGMLQYDKDKNGLYFDAQSAPARRA